MPLLVKDSYLVKLVQLEHDEEGKSLILFTHSCRCSGHSIAQTLQQSRLPVYSCLFLSSPSGAVKCMPCC